MKIFASWSGDHSKEIAIEFKNWLPKVLPGTDVFVSPQIESGESWFEVIMENLRSSGYGISFVTLNNVANPWLQFESGALALKFEKAKISPVLCNLDNSQVPSNNPLSNFQAVQIDHEGLVNLVRSIRRHITYPSVAIEKIDETVSVFEDEFIAAVQGINKKFSDNKSVHRPTAASESREESLKETLSDLFGEVRSISGRLDQIVRSNIQNDSEQITFGSTWGEKVLSANRNLIDSLKSSRISTIKDKIESASNVDDVDVIKRMLSESEALLSLREFKDLSMLIEEKIRALS